MFLGLETMAFVFEKKLSSVEEDDLGVSDRPRIPVATEKASKQIAPLSQSYSSLFTEVRSDQLRPSLKIREKKKHPQATMLGGRGWSELLELDQA